MSKTAPISVFLFDDHPFLRLGIARFLVEDGLSVCGEASDEGDLLGHLETVTPNVLVADLSIGRRDATPLLGILARRAPPVPVLIFSMHEDAYHVQRALSAGARGYVSKQETPDVLVQAIHAIQRGRIFLSPRIALVLQAADTQRSHAIAQNGFTPKEYEIYCLIGDGFAPREIAARLKVSVKTIETHLSRLQRKLNVLDRRDLMRHAIESRRSTLVDGSFSPEAVS
jgi:DNA-binding NarL/FixJ family response regulator